jgi:hypothetical protein
MRVRPSPGVLLVLAAAGATCGGQAAMAQTATTANPTGTFVAVPTIPGISTNLLLVQQLLDGAGQLEQGALSAGGANVSANIGRLNSSSSASSQGVRRHRALPPRRVAERRGRAPGSVTDPLAYSRRSASIGSRRAARRAG